MEEAQVLRLESARVQDENDVRALEEVERGPERLDPVRRLTRQRRDERLQSRGPGAGAQDDGLLRRVRGG